MKLSRQSLRKIILSEIKTIMLEQSGDGELTPQEAEELRILTNKAIEDAESDGPQGETFSTLPEEIKTLIEIYFEPDEPGYAALESIWEAEASDTWVNVDRDPADYGDLSDYIQMKIAHGEAVRFGIDAKAVDITADWEDMQFEGPDAVKAKIYNDKINPKFVGSKHIPDSDLGELVLKAAQELSEQLLEDSDDRDEFFAQREEEEYERRNPYRSRGLSPSDFI
jgi:hypothetical protein